MLKTTLKRKYPYILDEEIRNYAGYYVIVIQLETYPATLCSDDGAGMLQNTLLLCHLTPC